MNFATALNTLWPNGDERIPGLRAGIIATADEVFDEYGFDTPQVIAHFMAQVSHECGAGHDVVENLNYSPQRMVQVWPSRFPTITSAMPYAHNPQALANKVYNGRMGNRPGSNDGWDFRGRGGCQTTGREGYTKVADRTGLDLLNNPDLLNDPDHFLECAAADFVICGCLPFAQKNQFTNETKALNGGIIGLPERKVWLKKWTAADLPAPSAPVPVVKANTAVVASAAPTLPWWKRWF